MKNPQTVEYDGSAQLYKENDRCDYEGAGGGMSASENRMANFKGRTIGDYSGAPKATNHGRDLGKDATNVIKKFSTANTEEEVSPSATRQSGNKDQMQSY